MDRENESRLASEEPTSRKQDVGHPAAQPKGSAHLKASCGASARQPYLTQSVRPLIMPAEESLPTEQPAAVTPQTSVQAPIAAETVGQLAAKIPVQLSTRFLEHFSEQLYSSPQKAFEELISNGWDAGADNVEVVVPDDLNELNATLAVLDNGSSMDEEGLRQLWRIAFSPKTSTPAANGRAVVGKFGIGKLATYVLANKLTYICHALDGKTRRVTMNFGTVDKNADPSADRLISDMELEVFELDESELSEALSSISDGGRLAELIATDIPKAILEADVDEFRSPPDSYAKPQSKTWTLAVLSDLKATGRNINRGVLKRMLRSALPFGHEMAIVLNGEVLQSSKITTPITQEWIVGPDLAISDVELESFSTVNNQQVKKVEKVTLSSSDAPYPHVEIPGVGRVTGRVLLFVEKVSGGKSDDVAASNGFHVNVLGRVVNLADPTFGETNLSHSAWSRFRMTIRADGLNSLLTTDREKFKECRDLHIFRAFLRRVFNKARSEYDSDINVTLPDGGDVLVKSLGIVSLASLRNVVSEALSHQPTLPSLFDATGIRDSEEKLRSWKEQTAENISNALEQVKYESVNENFFVRFRLSDNTIVINKQHPFVLEHSRSRAEKELLRTIAMVNLLSDVYALDSGIAPALLQSMISYRDRLLRFRSIQQRGSGTYIAKLLLEMQHDSSKSKRLEAVLSTALTYLGFDVEDLAKPGQPEGVASAYPLPTRSNPTKADPHPPLYSFTFDAKTSKHDVAQTGNLNLDGVVQHRKEWGTNYSLVVAPGFEAGAAAIRCTELSITPIMAKDLGKLLEFTVQYGAIPLDKLREIFSLYNPVAVSEWVVALEPWLQEQRPLTIDIFLKALNNLKGKVPDAVAASQIGFECRENLGAYSVKDSDVLAVATGLKILVPDLVGVEGSEIIVNASAERVAAAVAAQLELMHKDDVPGGRNLD